MKNCLKPAKSCFVVTMPTSSSVWQLGRKCLFKWGLANEGGGRCRLIQRNAEIFHHIEHFQPLTHNLHPLAKFLTNYVTFYLFRQIAKSIHLSGCCTA